MPSIAPDNGTRADRIPLDKTHRIGYNEHGIEARGNGATSCTSRMGSRHNVTCFSYRVGESMAFRCAYALLTWDTNSVGRAGFYVWERSGTMIIQEGKREQCSECGLWHTALEEVIGCDVCKSVLPQSETTISLTLFYGDCRTAGYEYCSWACFWAHFRTLPMDGVSFIGFPIIDLDDDVPTTQSYSAFCKHIQFVLPD